jgi:sialic acid synthase SpsE
MKRVVAIRRRPISPGHPTLAVAQGTTNHNGDLDLAQPPIEAAAQAGAYAV